MLAYNIDPHRLPEKLREVLDNHEVAFVVKSRKEPVLWLSTSLFSLIIMFFLILFAYDYLKKIVLIFQSFHINFLTLFLILVLIAGVLAFIKYTKDISDFFTGTVLKLFKPPPVFAGTRKYLIIYQKGQIFMIAWKYFNPTSIVETGFGGRGDLILRLYYKEDIINAYDGKIYHPAVITMTEIDEVEKISDICEKFIIKAQNQWD